MITEQTLKKNNMNTAHEFEIVLENTRMKEDLGIEVLATAKCVVDLASIIGYRESFSDNMEVEPYTVILFSPGFSWTLNIPYNEFKILHNREILGIDEQR